jgi:hypothetical protein
MCTLTSDDGVLLCPKLVCPAEERVLGYPQAIVPDATDRIKTSSGFKPRKVVQSPPAGSLMNRSTKVLVTAVDESDQAESCEWMLTYPMMETITELYEDIDIGTYERDIDLWYEDEEDGYYAPGGLVLVFAARLEHRLDGNGTVTVSTAFNESLTLSSVVNEDTVWVQKPFTNETSNLTLRVRDFVAEDYLIIKLYGQVA